jgi:adenylate cyclase
VSNGARRLAAIMFTDLVGFTRLGQRDEEGALRLRKEHQSLLRPVLTAHGGREVKTLGDGFLVEFPSAVSSVRCAVEIQESVAARNALPASGEPIVLRIGIHVGEVIEEGSDIVGDAVNVASRIEPLAEAGGICVSGSVFDQVRNKLRLPLEKVGTRTLKNVEFPVEIYRVDLSGTPARPPPSTGSGGTVARVAVLPFASLSPDANDEYFADGLTDELIARSSKIPRLRVIARTSVLRYKGSSRSVREVGHDLGVGLVLEGSVRKAGNRVRVTVQLVDTATEVPLWSSGYERPLDDIFAIQDDIAGQVAMLVAAHVSDGPGGAPAAPPPPYVHVVRDTPNMEAYTDFLHGRKLLGEKGSEATIRQALAFFEDAVRLDPKFARARVGIADAVNWLGGEAALPWAAAKAKSLEEVTRALELDDSLAEAHSCRASILLTTGDFAESQREARRAVDLNPSLADPYRWLAQIAAGAGRVDETVRLLETAAQIDPLDINILAFLGRAYFYAGREAEALAHWNRTKPLVTYRTNAHLTEYYLSHQNYPKAEETVRELERLRPGNVWTEMYRGFLAARQGDRSTALRQIEQLEGRPDGKDIAAWMVGFVRFALGDTGAFFDTMEESQRAGAEPAMELMYSPLFDSARTDPRYLALRTKWDDARRSVS